MGMMASEFVIEDGFVGRRRVAVPINIELLIDMVRVGARTRACYCVEGVPKSAAFVGTYFDMARRTGYLVFESDEFELIPLEQELPEVKVIFDALGDASDWETEE